MGKNKIENSSNGPTLEKTKIMKSVFFKNSYTHIIIIGIVAISLRLYYVEFEIPFALDNLEYFLYAYDTSILGHLPEDYSPANNGWPAFVSIFFSMFQFDDPISYMQLQKLISIIISTLTIVPVYLLCRNYFNKTLSLVGVCIFAFEPRLIQNSLYGITEPLYIFLIATTLVLFLSENKKFVYLAFAVVALTSMVRAEGVILFLIISIMFFVRYRKSIKVIPKYIPALLIFILILLPMMNYKQEIHEDDRIFGRIGEALSDKSNVGFFEATKNEERVLAGIINFSKFFVWDLIPIFIIFVPVGIFLIFRDLNYKKITIIIAVLGMSIPAFYAYSLSSLDTRYLYALYPMLSIISIFAVEKYLHKINRKKLATIMIIVGIFITSNIFLDYTKMNYEHEKDAFVVAQYITKYTDGINYYSPESQYIKVAEVFKNWPELPPHNFDGHFEVIMPRISTNGFNSIDEFIKTSKNQGLTHLVIDNNQNRPDFFKEVFKNEDVSYLIKEYDSKDNGLNYHVKIFRIDYEKFE